jgi:adenylate cyclase
MERRLAAIVAGDIVGYSRLMADDEAATYAALRSALDDLITPVLERHGGRVFKSAGDGFLAAFPSVNEALDAAIEIQAGFDDRAFDLRIGVNLGDVIEDKGDMFGDGVNVAARLEAMADPGSIFVSAAVVRGADRNRGAHFSRVGRRHVKNIPESLDVYAVRLKSGRRRMARWLPRAMRGRRACFRMPRVRRRSRLLLSRSATPPDWRPWLPASPRALPDWPASKTPTLGRPLRFFHSTI